MLEISILPSGHLRCHLPPGGTDNFHLERVRSAFVKSGEGEGLVRLAGLRSLEGLSAGAMFWRQFAEKFLRAFAERAPETDRRLRAGAEIDGDFSGEEFSPAALPPPAPAETLRILLALPPMTGGEYLTVSALDGRWRAMDNWARETCAELNGTAPFFLQYAPQLRNSGKICLHLAEKNDENQPFALLTSYSSGIDKNGQPARIKLTAALAERLPDILAPLRRAAEKSAVLAPLFAAGRLFAPVPLNAQSAYAFLKDTPLYEQCGIAVQVPDWWHRRLSAQVQFTIGNSSLRRFTGDALLDCAVGLSAAGRTLPEDAAAALLQGETGLRRIYGTWVEVDPPKLREVMRHFQEVLRKKSDGLTFAESMRLLAGIPENDESEDSQAATADERNWCRAVAGRGLREILARLRPPGGDAPSGDGETATAADNRPAEKPLPLGRHFPTRLRPYQEQGVRWLYLCSRLGLGACLADDMGLGKTLQIIALLVLYKRRARRAEKVLRPSLIIVPASLLGNWQGEFARFAPKLRCRFLHPDFCDADLATLGEHAGAYFDGVDAVVTTYGLITRTGWLRARKWHLLILDEAQAIKNPAARQTKAVKTLRARARIALSGTPVENRLSDLWSLFDFLNPGLLGTVQAFKLWTLRQEHGENGFAPLRRLLAPYILRRLKTDDAIIGDLPEKTEVDAFCELSETQARLYRENVTRLADELEHTDGFARRGLVLAYLMRFKQICNHPAQFLRQSFFAPEESGKFLRLREIVEKITSRQEKALIFTQFKEMTAPLAAFLRTLFGEEGLILHGTTPPGERARRVADFQREDGPPFFVLSLKAGGTGLNLTAASHVIHFDRWWNPAIEKQATDRAYRWGQHRNVIVHRFVCRGTLEEKISALLGDKAALAAELLDGDDSAPRLTEMSNEEILRLVELDLGKIAKFPRPADS